MKIYVDMDGVLCNFKKVYETVDMPNTPRKFRTVVSHLKIFENLEWMENGKRLLSRLKTIGADIEILSSRGTHDDVVGEEAIRQKNIWLDKHGIDYPRNFVKVGIDKRNYSLENTYLIDDTARVVDSFNLGTGKAFLYEDFNHSKFMQNFEMHIWQL